MLSIFMDRRVVRKRIHIEVLIKIHINIEITGLNQRSDKDLPEIIRQIKWLHRFGPVLFNW
jgi:hypothetical protein